MAQKNETPALLVSLGITIALLAAGVWWFTQYSGQNLTGFLNSQPGTSSNNQGTNLTPASTGETFASVKNVPSGLFSYGGSTTWAPIRGQVDSLIQQVLPKFRLRYVDPLSEVPGSSSGIRMVMNNQLAFAQSSRSLRQEEYQQAQQRGFELQEIPVALDGIAIAVNPSLDLPGLTITQLREIYTGKITNWRQVGGPNLKITPYSRQLTDGGTVEFFVENVLSNQNFGSGVQFVPTTTQALRQVASNPEGIYFASAPELVPQCSVKSLPLGRRANDLIPPYQEPYVPLSRCPAQRNQLNQAALQNGQYPITRRLFVITKKNSQADAQAGQAYADLLLTDQGQDLIEKAGYVPIH